MTGPMAAGERTILFSAAEAATIAGGRIAAGPEQSRLLGFSIDTRSLEPGDCFAAMPGQNTDGHAFLEAAARRGASAALITRAIEQPPAGLTLIRVEDAVAALQKLCVAWRRRFDIPTIAVTGSNGKTSTRSALAAVLGAGLRVWSTRGNLNNHIGLPLSLFGLRGEHQAGVFELGMNHLGEIAELCRLLEPRMGAITNIGPAHLEGCGSLENVARAKGELMEALPAGGELFVNAECALSRGIAARFAGKVFPVSVLGAGGGAYCFCDRLEVGFNRVTGTIRIPAAEMSFEFDAALSGRHMAYPLVFAAAVAARMGLQPAAIQEGLTRFRPEHGRMEASQRDGIWIVDDCYNANPASMAAALDYLETVPVQGRRFAVLGDMLELGDVSRQYHEQTISRCLAAAAFEGVWLFGREFETAWRGPAGRVRTCGDKGDIARQLGEQLAPGDVLLVKGSRGVALETVLKALLPPLTSAGPEKK